MLASRFRFNSIRRSVMALVTVALAVTAGCGKSDRPATYPVTGKVTFGDDTPLAGGQITFRSLDHPLSASGAIQPDGTFQLTTYEPNDGAVAGRHRAAVVPPTPTDFDPDEGPFTPLIDPRLQDLQASGLEFTVTADGPNDFPVLVERP